MPNSVSPSPPSSITKAQECVWLITPFHSAYYLIFGRLQIAYNCPLFLVYVPFALGFRSPSYWHMDTISLPLECGLPVTCFGPHKVVEVALGLSASLLALLEPCPVAIWPSLAILLGGERPCGAEMRSPVRGDSRLATSQLTWLQTQGAWMNMNENRRTTQLSSAQSPDQ